SWRGWGVGRWGIAQQFGALVLLASILPLILLGLSAATVARNQLAAELDHFLGQIIDHKRDYLDLQLRQVETLMANLASSEEILSAAAEPHADDVYWQLSTQVRIGNLLSGYANLQDLVSIDLFGSNGSHYHVGDTLDDSRLHRALKEQLLDRALAHPGPLLWAGVEPNVNAASAHPLVITAAQALTQVSRETLTREPVGLLLVNLDPKGLYRSLETVDLGPGGLLLVVDGANRLIYHSDPSQIGTALQVPWSKGLSAPAAGTVVTFQDREMVYYGVSSKRAPWRIVGLVPTTALAAKTQSIYTTTLALLGGCLLLASLAISSFLKGVLRPIKGVIAGFQRFHRQALELDNYLVATHRHEIGDLVRGFNTLLNGEHQRRRAEAALARQERRYRHIAEHSLDGFAFVDPDGRIVECNRAFRRLVGLADDASLPPHDALVPPPWRQTVAERLREVRATGRTPLWEMEYQRRDTTTVAVELWFYRDLEDDAPNGGHWLFVRDIEVRRRLEQRRLKADRMATLGRITGSVAHDFNNLLTVIQGNLQLLGLAHPPLRHHQQQLLDDAMQAVRTGAGLIEQMLALVRHSPLRLEMVDAVDFCDGIQRFARGLLPREVVFEVEVLPGESLVTDRHQLESALLNGIVNARDAMPQGGRLTLTLERLPWSVIAPLPAADDLIPGSHWRLTLKDTGVGMDQEVQRRALEPFYTTKAQGSGLGLSSTAAFVRRLRGTVTLVSRPGEGTTLSLWLPVDVKATADEAQPVDKVERTQRPVTTGGP
ncbi:MAG: ATP-binding protein, partial [Candidatus Competibacterales bacterium]